jgi:hypothetical protein
MDGPTTTLTERIGFAEGWLRRARRQIQGGRIAHAALTVILAEAELHRAREQALPLIGAATISRVPTRRPRSFALGVVLAAGGLAVVALVAGQLVQPPLASVSTDDPGPAIVTLSGGTGEMFRIITVPGPVVERTVVRSRVVHLAPRPSPRAVSSQVARRPSVGSAGTVAPASVRSVAQAPPASPTSAAAPAATTAAGPVASLSLLSDADVIELVLAAERSLRRSTDQ